MSAELSPVMEEGVKEFTDILMTKHRAISTNLKQEMTSVYEMSEEEMKSMQQDIRQLRRELKRMYRDNELYMQTLEGMYKGTMEAMLYVVSVILQIRYIEDIC